MVRESKEVLLIFERFFRGAHFAQLLRAFLAHVELENASEHRMHLRRKEAKRQRNEEMRNTSIPLAVRKKAQVIVLSLTEYAGCTGASAIAMRVASGMNVVAYNIYRVVKQYINYKIDENDRKSNKLRHNYAFFINRAMKMFKLLTFLYCNSCSLSEHIASYTKHVYLYIKSICINKYSSIGNDIGSRVYVKPIKLGIY